MRIGQGFDLHFLAPGRKLFLGGVEIPFGMGLEGYSDGDVLLHAVIDAVLGALSLGDIGRHFPTGDPMWKDARSTCMLRRVVEMMRKEGYGLANLDSTVFADEPVLSPFITGMEESLAGIFGCLVDSVSVKAKTLEGLASASPRPAMAAAAVVLLEKGGEK